MKRRPTCKLPGCERYLFRRGLCHGHYDRATGRRQAEMPLGERKKLGPLCGVAGCSSKPKAKGLCESHWERQHKGDPEWDRPVIRIGMGLCRPINVRLHRFALDALIRRSKSVRVPVTTLLRALVEQWASTFGAEHQQGTDEPPESSWKRSNYDARGDM